jgi:hypothetical protein
MSGEHACVVCGEGFASKNRLFRHLRAGGPCAQAAGLAPPSSTLRPPEPSADEVAGTYVYVIGGRERGHTLGGCVSPAQLGACKPELRTAAAPPDVALRRAQVSSSAFRSRARRGKNVPT